MQVMPVLAVSPIEQMNSKSRAGIQNAAGETEKQFASFFETNHLTKEEQVIPIEETVLTQNEIENLPIREELYQLIDSMLTEQFTELPDEAFSQAIPDMNHAEMDEQMVEQIAIKNDVIQQEVIPMIQTIKTILSGSQQGENIKEIARNILSVLEKWTAFKQQLGDTELELQLEEHLSKEELNIFKFLESNVEKRQYFASQYRQDATITRADVTNWLQVAIDRYSTTESETRVVTAPTMTHQQVMPMNEIQQYTIHLQSLERVDRISEELTEKLVNVIRESRFLTKPNHVHPMNQLTIVLRPEHLGNITVRIQQIDGTMTLQMLVTSQTTKEILEANIHQLKHMFAPHQVVIERDEAIPEEDFYREELEHEEEDEAFDQSHESSKNEHDEDADVDFQRFIEQLVEGGINDE